MGLLDQFFGNADQTAALGLLGAGMMSGNTPGGLVAAQGLLQEAPSRRMRQQLMEAQMQETLAQAQERQEALRRQRGLSELATQFYNPAQQAQGGTADVNAALPPELRIGAQAPIPGRAPGFDVRGYTDAAMGRNLMDPLEAIKLQKAMSPESQINKLDAKDFTPASLAKFARSQNYADLERLDKLHFQDTGGSVNGLNPFTGQQVSTLPKTGNPFSDLILRGPDGSMTTNAPLVGAKRSIAAAGAPQVNVNTDKSYFGNVAEGLAKNDVAIIDAARSAPDRIASASRVKEILDSNPITGSFAEQRLAVHKALATAGVVDGKNVANTEVLASTLASQTLDAIKTSGLGSGQGFTDKDRAFLERAKSGNIEMTAASLRQLADMNERAARASIQRGNAVIGKLRKSPQAGAMGQQLDPIEEPLPRSVVRKPTAPSAGGLTPQEQTELEQLRRQFGRGG